MNRITKQASSFAIDCLRKHLGVAFATLVSVVCVSTPGIAGNWPQWRGPAFNGSAEETNLPAEWSATNHVLWTAALPGPSGATPVVFGDRVFVSASDKTAREILAIGLDAGTGRELWRQPLAPDRSTPGNNNMASPSPVTDGQRAWFLTGNGALASFARDGQLVWKRDLAKDYGMFVNYFGYSSSPLLFDGKLYVVALQNDDPHKGGLNAGREGPLESYLLALDPATGKTLWKHVRATDAADQSREAYVTPYPWNRGGRWEIVLAGGECVTGHDPEKGAELWRWWFTPQDRQKLQHVVPTPVGSDDLLYVVRPEHRPLFAVRGLPGEEQAAWSFASNRCWIASPLLYRERLYVLQEEERSLACLEPRTGRIIWNHPLPVKSSLQASPTGVDGRIYLVSLEGEVAVLAAGDEYRQLAAFEVGEPQCRSAIAAANGRLFLRTAKTLYCIGNR